MLNIEFHFLAGRFHATPWDRQVNEGIVEWPVSPWRIVRSLLAVWYLKARDDVEVATVRSLLDKMSSPPGYRLPEASVGHTRHYMPLYRVDQRKSSKIFDTFAAIDKRYHISVVWPGVGLTESEARALDILLSRLGYLGRAESWVEAQRVNGDVTINCKPLGNGESCDSGKEVIQVLAPMAGHEYQTWRETWIDRAISMKLHEKRENARLKGKSIESVTLSKRDLESIENRAPPDLFSALQIETSDLKKSGWSQPPGSRWVPYARDADPFKVSPGSYVGKMAESRPTVARFAIASQAPPRLTDAIAVAERIHVSLVSHSNASTVFTGCDESGKPLEGHTHAHILLESNLYAGKGRRGDITHVTIYAPMGFTELERKAIDRLNKVWGHGGHDIQMILLGVGMPEDFAGMDVTRGMCPILTSARTWISRTPFIPTRHPKITRAGIPKIDENGIQIGSAEHELKRLLHEHGLPEPELIEPTFSTDLAGHETRWLEFRSTRKRGKGAKGTNLGFGFRIVFPRPVRGPMALGYGSHFGLGLFIPAPGSDGGDPSE